MKINYLYLVILLSVFGSCTVKKSNEVKINTKYNEQLFKSRKTIFGKLTIDETKELKATIENALNIKIADDKSILINYYQFGINCPEYDKKRKVIEASIERTSIVSTKIAKELNAVDFFVYSEDSLLKDYIEKRPEFILDNGFFSKNIFTLQENCRGFFILKPNGAVMKYYGEDYFGEVEQFLKKDL